MPKADARASWPWPGLGAEGALADRLTQSSPLSLLILLAAVVVLAVWRLVRPHGTAKGPGGIPVRTTPVPGPPPRWPLGNTMELAENEHRFLDWLLDGSRAYGGKDGLGAWAFSVAFLPKDTVVHDPECVRHVLMNVDLYGKGPVWRANFWPILGDGIFSADGHSWMVQRKRAANMFKAANFKHAMLEAVREKLLKFLGLLRDRVRAAASDDADSTDGSAVIEMQELFYKLTMDTIGEIAFGRDLGSLDGKNVAFMEAFDYCQHYANLLFFKSGPNWLWTTFTDAGRRFRRYVRVLDEYGTALVRDMVRERRAEEEAAAGVDRPLDDAAPTQEKKKRETILSFFLGDASRAELEDPRTVERLRHVAMNFQIAGRDAVAQAYSWALHLLALHPDAQQKLRDEALAILGPLPQAGNASYEQITRLVYGHAVATEALRLYPSVPSEGKWAFRDDVLPDGTPVRKGTWVLFSPYVMGRLEALWGADAGEFKPERHLGKPKPSNFVFTAFQGGPRICLGQNLAMLQLQYGLALLLLAFQVDPVEGGTGVRMCQSSATLPMVDGLRVRLTPLERAGL